MSGLRKWLHAHRFRYKKPHAVPTKIDSAAQQAFIEFYNKLKRQAGATEPIYFSDSTHPAHQTQLHYGSSLNRRYLLEESPSHLSAS